MIRVSIDGMGGDYAPKEICLGVMDALNKRADISVTIFGDKDLMAPYLKDNPRLKIVHTPTFLSMGEHDPLGAFRRKSDASMFLAIKDVALGNSDFVLSSGPTQVYVIGLHLILKKIKGMDRIAIAPILPGIESPKLLLDSGANIELKPEHLRQFALFGTVLARDVYKWDKFPKVGLLNIGTEEGKGRDLEKDTYELLKNDKNINFIGNIEPKECMSGDFSLIITDGFSGNILMKTMEGVGKGFGTILKTEIKKSIFSTIGALFMKKALDNLKITMDPASIGGAMIMGVNGIAIKAQGASKSKAISQAINQGCLCVSSNCLNIVKESLLKINE